MSTKYIGRCLAVLWLTLFCALSAVEAKPLLGETIVFTEMGVQIDDVVRGTSEFIGNTMTVQLESNDGIEPYPGGSVAMGPSNPNSEPLHESWEHGGLSFEQVRTLRVQATFDFSYEIFNPGWGAISAHIQLGNDVIFADSINNPVTPTTHTADHQIVSGEIPLGDLFTAGLLHLANGPVTSPQGFHGTLTLHSITIEFLTSLPYGTISGNIQDSGGTPIPNLNVFANDYSTNDWMGGTSTDSDGNYILFLPSGFYRIRACASCNGYLYVDEFYDNTYYFDSATGVSVTEPNEASGIDFVLALSSTISGMVSDEATSAPITGADIRIDVYMGDPCNDPQHVAQAPVDPATGAYTLANVPAETVYVRSSSRGEPDYLDRWWSSLGSMEACEDAEPLALSPGEVRPNLDFQMKLNPRSFEEVEGVFFSQWKTITIDGDYGDWDEHDRVYVDTDGPECNNAPGQDIRAIYIAQDTDFVYLRYILNAPLDATFGYKLIGGEDEGKHLYVGQNTDGNAFIFFTIPPVAPSTDWTAENLPGEYLRITSNQFEAKIPKTEVQMWAGEQLMAWLDQGYDTSCADHVRLPVMDIDYSSEPSGGLTLTTLISPKVRPARRYVLWFIYANESPFVIPDLNLRISNDSHTPMRLSPEEPFLNQAISITGTGTLSPGEERRIPIYFHVPGDLPAHHFIHFAIEKVVDSLPTLLTIAETEVIRPDDPNVKVATPGVGDDHYVMAGDALVYTVFFENKSSATASAQEVVITDTIDVNLDWSTFQLGEMAFGDVIVNDLAGLQSGQTVVMLNSEFAVCLGVERNAVNHVVTWTFRTVDSDDIDTCELTDDLEFGFLPPNDDTGQGEGHVTFSIRTRSDLNFGDVIANNAAIKFDTNDAMLTNAVTNTIGMPMPEAPTVPGIGDGAADVAVSSAFSWLASEYALSYDLVIANISDLENPDVLFIEDLATPFYDPQLDLAYDATYVWQVYAKNVMGEVASLMWSFTTASEPGNTVIPEPATLLFLGTGLLVMCGLGLRNKRKQ